MTQDPKRRKANRRSASGTPTARERSGPEPSAMNSRWTSKTRSYHCSDSSRSRTVIPTWCTSPKEVTAAASRRGPDEDLELVALRVDEPLEPPVDDVVERDLRGDG